MEKKKQTDKYANRNRLQNTLRLFYGVLCVWYKPVVSVKIVNGLIQLWVGHFRLPIDRFLISRSLILQQFLKKSRKFAQLIINESSKHLTSNVKMTIKPLIYHELNVVTMQFPLVLCDLDSSYPFHVYIRPQTPGFLFHLTLFADPLIVRSAYYIQLFNWRKECDECQLILFSNGINLSCHTKHKKSIKITNGNGN